jgi:hypothetical protein
VITVGLGTIALSNAGNPYRFGDKSFVMWAHNGSGVANWSGTQTSEGLHLLPRIWQVQATGASSSTFHLRAGSLPEDLGEVFLLVADDGKFTNSGTQIFKAHQIGSIWEVSFSLPSAISYMTLATASGSVFDTTPPAALAVLYTPATVTSGNVVVTLFVNEPVAPIDGRNGGTGQIFTRVFTGNFSGEVQFADLAGNGGMTGVVIDWIVPEEQLTPIVGTVSYSPETVTNGEVVATLTLNKTGVVLGT